MQLSGFTSNQIRTLGSISCEVQLREKSVQQIFHVVPHGVRMNNFDVILGRDFLCENGIILDFGTGKLYSNRNLTKIISISNTKSILKNRKDEKQNIKPVQETKPKISHAKNNVNAPILVSNYYNCLPIENEEILYGTDALTAEFVNAHFDNDLLEKVNTYSKKNPVRM